LGYVRSRLVVQNLGSLELHSGDKNMEDCNLHALKNKGGYKVLLRHDGILNKYEELR